MSIETTILLATATPAWLWGALVVALALGMFALTSDEGARRQSPTLRVPVPTDAAPIWIGLGVMVIFFIGTPVLLAAFWGTGVAATSRPATQSVNLERLIGANASTYLCSILAGVLIHLYMHSPARRFLGLAPPTWPQMRLWFSTVMVAIPMTYLVAGLTRQFLVWWGVPAPESHQMLEWMAQLRDRPAWRALAILSATVLAPVFEELFFRGHLQTALAGMLPNKWAAITIASFLFASVHDPWTMPAIFVLSFCLGALYERTNNLWLPVALHIAFNSVSTAVFLGVR